MADGADGSIGEHLIGSIPADWAAAIGPAALDCLPSIVGQLASQEKTLPAPELVFAALRATPFDAVRAVILGQDPYPTRSHAMGLAFSVPRELPPPLPRSLRNIRSELASDLSLALPDHGSLEAWTRHGVLLLNTSLTVREGMPGSHDKVPWPVLTDAIISAVAGRANPVAFLLWGNHAKAKARLIDPLRHVVVTSAHPSPLSQKGFLGTKPFSRANEGLQGKGASPIDWSLAD